MTMISESPATLSHGRRAALHAFEPADVFADLVSNAQTGLSDPDAALWPVYLGVDPGRGWQILHALSGPGAPVHPQTDSLSGKVRLRMGSGHSAPKVFFRAESRRYFFGR